MQRWLVILLVILALVILISPGIVGRLAEENLQTASPGRSWIAPALRSQRKLSSVAGLRLKGAIASFSKTANFKKLLKYFLPPPPVRRLTSGHWIAAKSVFQTVVRHLPSLGSRSALLAVSGVAD